MTSFSDSSPKPLIDTPVEALVEWDSPFRHSFVPGSLWAPWLMTAKFPSSGGPAAVRASPPLRTDRSADEAAKKLGRGVSADS